MKIKESYATETFIDGDGYYVIAQTDGISRFSVALSPHQMTIIAQEMNLLEDQCQKRWVKQSTESSASEVA